MAVCKICNNDKISEFYQVREMMFGLDETFTYFFCNNCNCLQIAAFPPSMDKYYGNNYYSLLPDKTLIKKLITQLAVWRDRAELNGNNFLGRIISNFAPSREEIRFISYLEGIEKDSKILDIGAGMGFHLRRLEAVGFTNLKGIDPFLKQEVITSSSITIFKKYLRDYTEKDFNLITLHHTFEHLPNPRETLELVYDKLLPGGYCVIRIPVVPNEAWSLYKENWFQIDAPRHFFILSPDTMAFLCKPIGFKIEGIIHDSMPSQYYISEQYRKGIPIIRQAKMSKEEKARFEQKTMIANRLGRGDQAIFILRK
jgi:SAM-dependent methyltransferase